MVVGLVKGERRPEIPDMMQIRGFRKGTNGVSTNVVTAIFIAFEREICWVPIYQHLAKSINI